MEFDPPEEEEEKGQGGWLQGTAIIGPSGSQSITTLRKNKETKKNIKLIL